MCNLFDLNKPLENLSVFFKALSQRSFEFAQTIAPKMDSPAMLLNESGRRELIRMRFGLIPVGAKTLRQKMPLNNARIENLDSWPWKTSISRHRCIVPMTSFYEFSYWGELPGRKLEFHSPATPVMSVAAIYNRFNLENVEGVSMTLVMRPASEQIMSMGHHRMPFFIEPDGFNDWISGDKRIDECRRSLSFHSSEPEFEFIDHGSMKDGWQKRVDTRLKKRDEQLRVIDKLGPLGVHS